MPGSRAEGTELRNIKEKKVQNRYQSARKLSIVVKTAQDARIKLLVSKAIIVRFHRKNARSI